MTGIQLQKKWRRFTIRFVVNLKKLRKVKFTTVVLLGLTVRILIAPFFAHPLDVFSWFTVGENLVSGKQSLESFLIPYDYAFFLFAFPGYLAFNLVTRYVPSGTFQMASLDPRLNPGIHFGITVVPGLLFDLLVKLPLIVSDTLIAVILFKLVFRSTNDERLATFAAALWFLNPLSIWVSSGWGMFDTLPALFTVLSIYFLLSKRFELSGLTLTSAIFLKYYAIVLAVPLLLMTWKTNGKNATLRILLPSVILSILLVLPLIRQDLSSLTGLIVGTPFESSSLHYAGLSLWTPFTLFIPHFNQGIISVIVLFPIIALIYLYEYKSYSGENFLTSTIMFSLPVSFLLIFYSFVAENFFIWLLPFASIIASIDKPYRKHYWIISGIVLLSSVTDSLLPYYMLPDSQWIGGFLLGVLNLLSPYKVASGNGGINPGFSLGKIFLICLSVASVLITGIMTLRALKIISSPQIVQTPLSAHQKRRILGSDPDTLLT